MCVRGVNFAAVFTTFPLNSGTVPIVLYFFVLIFFLVVNHMAGRNRIWNRKLFFPCYENIRKC